VTTLADFARIAGDDNNFCVAATTRADGSVQASVVNAGVMQHPLSGVDAVVFVARGGTTKLANLRRRPQATVVARSGGMWAAVEGHAVLVGPDDPHPAFDAERLRVLLRDAFTAAGGTHDDWDAYDRAMKEDRRVVVFVAPGRVYSNG
jgi:PPOX class probable F420-dependent enzyme